MSIHARIFQTSVIAVLALRIYVDARRVEIYLDSKGVTSSDGVNQRGGDVLDQELLVRALAQHAVQTIPAHSIFVAGKGRTLAPKSKVLSEGRGKRPEFFYVFFSPFSLFYF